VFPCAVFFGWDNDDADKNEREVQKGGQQVNITSVGGVSSSSPAVSDARLQSRFCEKKWHHKSTNG
jgi:hypothetical protein